MSITWEQCADLPVEVVEGSSIALNGKVYCQGAISNPESEYVVYFCDLKKDTMSWSSLPPLLFRDFSLSQVDSELVAVGGIRKLSNGAVSISNIIFTFDQTSQEWIQKIPPMPTCRYLTSVLSLPSALIVAGGHTTESSHTDVIEVFRSEFSMWYRTEPLLLKCSSVAMVAKDDNCYVLGGLESSSILNQVFYASIDDLLGNAVPVNEVSSSIMMISSCTQTIWKTAPSTPTYLCGQVATTLADKLIIVGGEVTSDGEESSNIVYMYSPSINEWVHISDLPTPRSRATVVTLSPGEILMVGGFGDDNLHAVYRGKLSIRF